MAPIIRLEMTSLDGFRILQPIKKEKLSMNNFVNRQESKWIIGKGGMKENNMCLQKLVIHCVSCRRGNAVAKRKNRRAEWRDLECRRHSELLCESIIH